MNEKLNLLRIYISNILPYFIAVALLLRPQSNMVTDIWKKINASNATFQNGQLEEYYRIMILQQPWQTDLYADLAALQFEKEDYGAVVQSLEQLKSYEKLNFSLDYILAIAYDESGNKDKALSLLKEISSRENLTFEERNQIFDMQEKNRDWEGAYKTIQRLSENESQNSEIQFRLALYQMIFAPENANESLLASLQGKPSWATKIKNLQTVVDDINDQDNPAFQLVLAGNGLANQGEWLLASAAFEEVTMIDPNYAEGWAFYGNALSFNGEDGLAALKKSKAINPQSKIVRSMLANYYQNHEELVLSMEIYRELSAEEPEEPFWHYEIANVYAKNGDLNSALVSHKQAIKNDPKNIFYWKELASFCLDYSFLVESEGIDAARQAMIIDNEDPEAYDIMGLIYLKMNNYANSERFLLEANKRAPYDSKILLHLGQLYYLKNEKNLAYFYLTNAIEYAQNDAIKKIAQDLVDVIQ